MNKKYYSSISYTYTVPDNGGFIEITPTQLAGLYEPHTDIIEKLLEYSDMKEANAVIARVK